MSHCRLTSNPIKFFICILAIISLSFNLTKSKAQSSTNSDSIQQKMQWFADAKLGIFIHWGIYAVNGIAESWSFHNKDISYADYMKQLRFIFYTIQ